MGRSTISEGLEHSFVRGGGYLSGVGLVVIGDSNPFAFSMCSEQFCCFFYSIFWTSKIKMPKNKCIFSDAWLNGSRFSEWLKRTHSKWKAYCTDCKKSFEISNMGVASLLSHASGEKHSDSAAHFFGNSSAGESQETNKKGNLARKENKVKKTLDRVTVPTSALRSDVLWTLNVISSHYCLRSCLGLKEFF